MFGLREKEESFGDSRVDIFGYANIMNSMSAESLAALFKTLSEPVRLRITYLLPRAGGGVSVIWWGALALS